MLMWLKLGLVGVWVAVIIVLFSIFAALQYSGDVASAKIVGRLLSYVLIAFLFYRIGQFHGIGIGKRIVLRERNMQLDLDLEHIDWFSDKSMLDNIGSFDADTSARKISSLTIDRLQRAIEAFPVRYPDFQTKPPKLDDDVHQWLKESGLVENDAERRVFGAIIREHFKLSPDTHKT